MRSEPLDRVLLLLFAGIIFFVIVLFASEIWFQNDSQLFQVVASTLTAFGGAFLARIKPGGQSTGTPNAPATPAAPGPSLDVKGEELSH